MLDLQQGLIIKNQSSSFNPICQTNNNHDSTKSIPFDEARKNRECESAAEFGSSEVEFQVQIQNGDACSPKLWKSSRNTKTEVYPLLPRSHRYSNLSPRSRVQAVVKGRMELMEMIQNMPESSYELSLRDIVDPELMKEAGCEKEFEDTRFDSKTEQVQNHQKTKKKKIKKKDISRTGSMDNSTFLLKMFFPASLTVKNSTTPEKKSTTRKHSKVISRSSSLEGNESLVRGSLEWWKKKVSVSFKGENIGRGRNSTGRLSTSSSSSSRSSNSSSRHAYSNFLPASWPFFHNKKGETWRQKGCIF